MASDSYANRLPVVILAGGLGFGGAERQLFNFIKLSSTDRYDYHIAVLNHDPFDTFDEALRDSGVHVWYPPDEVKGFGRRLIWLIRLLRKVKPLVAHSWIFYANPYVGLAGRIARIPLRLGAARNQPESYVGRYSVVHRWLAYHSVDGVVTNSQQSFDTLQQNFGVKRVYLVRNGLTDGVVEAPPARVDLSDYDIKEQDRIVATVGNLQKRKNQKMFIEAMSLVLPGFQDVRCLIVGQPIPSETAIEQQLQSLIDSYGLTDRIILTGFRSDVAELMHSLSVFCLTSYAEGSPNVIAEAMVAGCPVVSTGAGDVPNLIEHGENGLLVDFDDSEGLARTVTELLSDDDLAERIGQAGRLTAQRLFGGERMAREMEEVYERALLERAPHTIPAKDRA